MEEPPRPIRKAIARTQGAELQDIGNFPDKDVLHIKITNNKTGNKLIGRLNEVEDQVGEYGEYNINEIHGNKVFSFEVRQNDN